MRNPKRIPIILKQLEDLWMKYPDLRLGQLILNVFSLHNGIDARVYHMEDEDFIKEIKKAYDIEQPVMTIPSNEQRTTTTKSSIEISDKNNI